MFVSPEIPLPLLRRICTRLIAAFILAITCATIHASDTAPSPVRFRVLTFNSWHEWSKVEKGFDKAKAAIEAADVDLVGLQESSPAVAQRMADALGWNRVEVGTGSVQILTPHPILETFTCDGLTTDRFVAARIRISENPPCEVLFCDTHLDYVHYGPYAAQMPGATAESVLAENAQSERVSQLTAMLETMAPWIERADSLPVILVGDFNAPSHLDWTAATAETHGGVGPVQWQESTLAEKAGLRDSFRIAHPDPASNPGNSWSTIHKESEPQDRIDFIYFAGSSLNVVDSSLYATPIETTIGKWGTDDAPVRGNSWPSDHFGVLTTFSFDIAKSAGDALR